MYVCVCNAITDREVRAQAQCEGGKIAAVYRALGKKPQCGKCVPLVCRLVRQVVEVSRSPAAAAV